MRKRKNDYSIVIFFNNGKPPQKMEFVHNLLNCTKWLDNSRNYYDYIYINIYLRRSGEYIGRHYKGNFIYPFL